MRYYQNIDAQAAKRLIDGDYCGRNGRGQGGGIGRVSVGHFSEV